MPKQFQYLVECKYHSGKVLQKKYFVIAGDEAEADEELTICVGNYAPIREWRLVRLSGVSEIPDDSPWAEKYREQGPFTFYEPDYDLWEQFLNDK